MSGEEILTSGTIKIYDVVSNGKLIFDLLVFTLKSALGE
jgi:hypothetical protein